MANDQTTISFVVMGPLSLPDLPRLCGDISALIDTTGATCAVCDVGGAGPDAMIVDALARLRLAARERGCTVEIRGASEHLRELVAFMGLQGILWG